MKYKNILRAFAAGALLFASVFTGCSMLGDALESEDDDVIETRATSAEVDTDVYEDGKDYIKLSVGETQAITVLLSPYNASTEPTWTSSDTSIVTVEAGTLTRSAAEEYAKATATLTAIGTGTATVTATADGVSATIKVKVGGTLPAAAVWSMKSAPSVTYNGTVSTLDSTGIIPSDNTTPVYISSDSKSQTTLQFYSSLANSKGGISYKNNALYTGKNGSASVDTMAIRAAQYLVLNVASDNSTVSITAKPEAAALYRGMWFDDHQHTSSNDCTFDTWTDTSSTMSVYNTAEETTVTKTVNKGTYYIYINSVYISNITVTTDEKLITVTSSATSALIGRENAITITTSPANAKLVLTDGEDYATLTKGSDSWILTGTAAGEVEVTATADGYASSTTTYEFSLPTASATLASDTIFISGDNNSTTLTVLPVGATVTADSTTYATFEKASSSSAGDVYTVTGVANCGITETKTVIFTLTANKYNETTKSLSVKPLSITLTPSAETVTVGSSITITSDVENAVLTVNDTSVATIEKDSSGNWILTGVKKGSVTITASCAGYFNQTLDITVGEIVILAQWSLTSAPSVTYNGTTSTLDSTGINPDTTVGSVAIASDSESETTLEFCGDVNNSKKGSIAYSNNALVIGANGNCKGDDKNMRACQYFILTVAQDNSTVSITATPTGAAVSYRGIWFDTYQHTSKKDCKFAEWSDTNDTMSICNKLEEKTITKTVSAGTYYIYANSVSISNISVVGVE